MAESIINYWEWIGDDQYMQSGYEVFDSHNIDYSTSRKITAVWTYTWTDWTEVLTWVASTSIYHVTEINWVTAMSIWTWNAKVYYWWTTTDIWYSSRNHLTIWTWLSAYNETTNPNWMRHFFIPYNAGRIVYTNYNWTSVWTIDISAIARLNIAWAYPWAMCYVWKWSMLFSYWNWIFSLNPSTTTPSYTKEEIELPEWAFVNFIRYYWWQLWIIYTIEWINSTFIQWATYDGTDYKKSTYHVEVAWQKCIWACADSGTIYWVSDISINVFDWVQNTIIKTLYDKDWTSQYFYNPNGNQSRWVISYNAWFIRINSVGKFYLYWTKKPNTKKNLTEVSLSTSQQIACFSDGWKALVYNTPNTKMYNCTTDKAMYNSYIITNPFTWWRLSQRKKWLWMNIGYNMRQSWWGTIAISIITDDIIRSNNWENYSDYVTIATITDPTNTFFEIMPTTISSALWTAWYSEEFGLIKIRIDLYWWSAAWWLTETRYNYFPDLFDIYFYYEEVWN